MGFIKKHIHKNILNIFILNISNISAFSTQYLTRGRKKRNEIMAHISFLIKNEKAGKILIILHPEYVQSLLLLESPVRKLRLSLNFMECYIYPSSILNISPF